VFDFRTNKIFEISSVWGATCSPNQKAFYRVGCGRALVLKFADIKLENYALAIK
jgi:hypothetical protein